MKNNDVLMGLLAFAILLAIGSLFAATASAAPMTAPISVTFGISHTIVTGVDRPSHMQVFVSGAGTVDVIRQARDGTNDTKTVRLALSPKTFRSTGHRDKTPVGASVRNSQKLVIWSGYNISHLPCSTGLPSMQFVGGANGISFSVSNPTSNPFWAVVNQTLGDAITDWREVAPGATVTFNSLPTAASGYVSMHAGVGPNAVCSNLGWDFP